MPGKRRWAEYTIHPDRLVGKGPYTARIRFIVGMVPINLVHAIKDVGFDYDMSPREIADGVLEGHTVLWERMIQFDPDKQTSTELIDE